MISTTTLYGKWMVVWCMFIYIFIYIYILHVKFNEILVLCYLMSVSYTHLDVYKRQELRVYKQGDADSYSLLLKKPVCEASALSVTQTGFLPSNDKEESVYSVVVGCKDGYFHVYDISLEKNMMVKSFAKKLGQPVDQVLTALPYLLISTSNHIYMLSLIHI